MNFILILGAFMTYEKNDLISCTVDAILNNKGDEIFSKAEIRYKAV